MTRAYSSQEGQQTCAAAGSYMGLKIYWGLLRQSVSKAEKNKLGMRNRIAVEAPETADGQKGSQASPTDPTPKGLVGKIRLIPSGCQGAKGFLDWTSWHHDSAVLRGVGREALDLSLWLSQSSLTSFKWEELAPTHNIWDFKLLSLVRVNKIPDPAGKVLVFQAYGAQQGRYFSEHSCTFKWLQLFLND